MHRYNLYYYLQGTDQNEQGVAGQDGVFPCRVKICAFSVTPFRAVQCPLVRFKDKLSVPGIYLHSSQGREGKKTIYQLPLM